MMNSFINMLRYESEINDDVNHNHTSFLASMVKLPFNNLFVKCSNTDISSITHRLCVQTEKDKKESSVIL